MPSGTVTVQHKQTYLPTPKGTTLSAGPKATIVDCLQINTCFAPEAIGQPRTDSMPLYNSMLCAATLHQNDLRQTVCRIVPALW